jgi:predicted metal-dependent hydrolase
MIHVVLTIQVVVPPSFSLHSSPTILKEKREKLPENLEEIENHPMIIFLKSKNINFYIKIIIFL